MSILLICTKIKKQKHSLSIVDIQIVSLHLGHPKSPRLILSTLIHDLTARQHIRGHGLGQRAGAGVAAGVLAAAVAAHAADQHGLRLRAGVDLGVDGAVDGRLEVRAVGRVPVALHEHDGVVQRRRLAVRVPGKLLRERRAQPGVADEHVLLVARLIDLTYVEDGDFGAFLSLVLYHTRVK